MVGSSHPQNSVAQADNRPFDRNWAGAAGHFEVAVGQVNAGLGEARDAPGEAAADQPGVEQQGNRDGHQEAEHVAGGLVGPVGVLDHDEDGGIVRDGGEEVAERVVDVAAVEGLVAGSSYNTLSIDSGGNSGNEDAPAIADTLGDVDLGLDQIENREALRPLLAALPERERMVLLLRFFENLTQTQIAERVGISQMHVSRLLAKSLTRLRDQLQ